MQFDLAEADPSIAGKLLTSLITPRPIAWVVSRSNSGILNAAPFSFFNAFCVDPPILGVGLNAAAHGRKDTRRNIGETGEFVVNLVPEALAREMNVTAYEFDYGVSEVAEARLATAPSSRIGTPRIAASPVAFECAVHQLIELGNDNTLVLGKVVMVHVDDAFVLDAERAYIDTPALQLIARMHGGGWYAATRDLFEMARPLDADIAAWRAGGS